MEEFLLYFSKLRLRLRSLFRRDRVEEELNNELRFHLEILVAEKTATGMSAEEARYAALRELGGEDQIKEECRDMRQVHYIENLVQDVHYGLRQLRRNPGFTAVAVLTLALGIGANTAIFSVVNAVVLRPLPYPQSNRLVWIAEVIPSFNAELAAGADYLDWRDQNKTFEGMTAYDPAASFNLTGRGTPERVHAAQVSANFFPTIGVTPKLGRSFTREEDQPNGPKTVVLMQSFWQQYFGSDSQVLGQTVTLNGTPYVVVGVMPASFRFPGDAEIQMLVPLQMNEARERLRQMMALVRIIGLLKPGVTIARAQSDLDAIRKRAQPPQMSGGGPGPGPMGMPAGGGAMMRVTTSGNTPPPAGSGPVRMPPGEDSGNNNVFVGRAVNAPGQEKENVMRGPTGKGPIPGNAPLVARHLSGGEPSKGTMLRAAPGTAVNSGGPGGPAGSPALGGGPHRMRMGGPPDAQLKVITLEEHLAGNLRPAMLTLLGAVGLVLLIACANVANLMLTRASTRTREVALRAVLGAGRWRLVRQLLSESLILGLAGGLAGLLLAAWGMNVMTRLIPASIGAGILNVAPVRLDAPVLFFTLAVSVITGILFGLAPALAATRLNLSEKLKEGAPGTGARRGMLRGALAVAELSLALVLLIGAGLLIKSFYRVLSVDPGFTTDHVLTMNLSLTDSRYPQAIQKRAFYLEVLRRVESLPGVRSAAFVDSLPLSPYKAELFVLQRKATESGVASDNSLLLSRLVVSPAYFSTLGIRLLKGRTFTDADDDQAPKVAVINEALARHMWPGEDPLGKLLPLMDNNTTVIGVVGDTRHEGLSTDVKSEIYAPLLQEGTPSMQLAVRTAADPVSMISAVRTQIAAIDPEQPIYNVTTLEQTLSDSVSPRRFNMLMLGIFAGIALTLATVGIYGVMAFSVTQRTREIGIRMALGAERRDVLTLMARQAVGVTLAGVAFGLAGAWGLTRFLSSFLYGVRPTDTATFVLVTVALIAVSLLACYIPARRATKVDPMEALRYE
ncbi:MAG TPA: ABC transporter permease [Terriglobia bacterium]|nr:ABC transporter permease [Terriglobia bacterium]